MSNAFDSSLLGKIGSYTEILAKDPHSTVFVPLADAYRQLGLLEDALEVAKKGVAALPRFSPGFVILGRLQFESGDLDGALDSLQAAYDLDEESLSAVRGLARVLVSKGEKGQAREILEKAARQHPQDAGIRKMLASLPAPAARGARPERNEEPIATPTIAEIYLKQGLPDRALKVYRDLLRTNPENGELKAKLADLEKSLARGKGEDSDAGEGTALGRTLEELPPANEPIASVAVPVQAPAAPAIDARLGKLERWLAAIHRRREHVR